MLFSTQTGIALTNSRISECVPAALNEKPQLHGRCAKILLGIQPCGRTLHFVYDSLQNDGAQSSVTWFQQKILIINLKHRRIWRNDAVFVMQMFHAKHT